MWNAKCKVRSVECGVRNVGEASLPNIKDKYSPVCKSVAKPIPLFCFSKKEGWAFVSAAGGRNSEQ